MKTQARRFVLFVVLLLFAICDTTTFASDNYYYYDGAQVPVVASNVKIVIQFDSTQGQSHGGAEFLTAHPCIMGLPQPEYVGRDYWIYNLQSGCNYAAAASDLSGDPDVNRVVPLYLTARDSVEFVVQDLIVVRFDDNLSVDSGLSIIGTNGLVLRDSSEYKHNLWRCALNDTNDADPLDAGNAMQMLPETEWACADALIKGKLHAEPSDGYYPNQYYLKNTGQTGGTAGVDIDAELAWQVPLQDSTLKVAIIDDGITVHQDLPAERILPGFDAAGYDATLVEYDFDAAPGYVHGHGMACGSILAASHNDTGVVGVFGSCRIVPVKIIEDSSRGMFAHGYDVSQAIYFAAASGAKVLSNSWGFGTADGWEYVAEAIRDAVSPNPPWRNYGCVVVFSAGNEGDEPKAPPIAFPATMNEVITVGAVDKFGAKWPYSQKGPSLDVMAPSGDKGKNMSRPGDMWTSDQIGEPGLNPPKFCPSWVDTDDLDYTKVFGGTSGAAPQVAGIAALILACRPDFSTDPQLRDTLNRVIEHIIESSATDLGPPGYDTLYGYGLVNAYRALLSVYGCFCPYRCDYDEDGVLTALDLGDLIDVQFAGKPDIQDPGCPTTRMDFDADGFVTALDLGKMIDHLYAGKVGPSSPCDP